MDMFLIRGRNQLTGTIRAGGSKNAALPIMAAALAADGPVVLHDVPYLVDVQTLSDLLASLGMLVDRRTDDALYLECTDDTVSVADYELVRRMRASFCVLGPLLARRGHACVSLPGGCNIGDRPIDLHLKGLVALGADIRVDRGYVIAAASKLRGARIFLGGPFGSTVTGTCNVMVAASLAKGTTTIEAAACEPEVVDLGQFLNAMGARISGLGTPFLEIEGVDHLTGVEYEIIPDRIETASLLIAGAITDGDVTVVNARATHLTAVLDALQEIGVSLAVDRDSIRATTDGPLHPTDCTALPFPGIPTDVQAQLIALLTRAAGISVVTDKVFPDRFMHAAELVRLGARIRREGPTAVIHGGAELSGACVMASDLRASAALVMAALAAKDESVVRRIYHLDRGYEQLDLRLNALGADIQRIEDTPANFPLSLQPGADRQPGDALVPGPHYASSPRTANRQGRRQKAEG